MRKRSNQIVVRLNDDELAMLKAEMELTGLSYSSLFRKYIRDARVSVYPAEEMKILIANVSKIGSNINQIARVANNTKNVDASMLTEASFQVDKLWRLIKALDTWR